MRSLFLLRHAKSSWSDPSLRDERRPLAPRGRKAVRLLRDRFAADGLSVDLVVCSTAERTRETWAGVGSGVGGEPQVRFEPAVYEASWPELLELVRHVPDEVDAVLLIGHNPGLAELADRLVDTGFDTKFPTGGFVALQLPGSWADVDAGCATLTSFLRPRELG